MPDKDLTTPNQNNTKLRPTGATTRQVLADYLGVSSVKTLRKMCEDEGIKVPVRSLLNPKLVDRIIRIIGPDSPGD